MDVTTYDLSDVNLVVNGIVITGFAKDSIITSEKNEDNFSPYVGARGDVTFAESNDKTGKITCKLKGTSPCCDLLDRWARVKGENALTTVQIIDLSTGGVSSGGTKCRVLKPSKKEYGVEEGEREYEIFVADYACK